MKPGRLILRSLGIALLATVVVIAAGVGVLFSGVEMRADFLRPPLERALSAAFGLPTRLEGRLSMRTGRVATLSADALVVADPAARPHRPRRAAARHGRARRSQRRRARTHARAPCRRARELGADLHVPVPMVPMALRGLWGSFFSRYGGAAFSRPIDARQRRGLRSRVELIVGQPLPPEAVTPERLMAQVAALRGGEP